LLEGKKKVSNYKPALTSSYLFHTLQFSSPVPSFPTSFSKAARRNRENYRSCKAKQLTCKISIWLSPILPPH